MRKANGAGGLRSDLRAYALAGGLAALSLLLSGCAGGLFPAPVEGESVQPLACGAPTAPNFSLSPRHGFAPLTVSFSSQGSSVTQWDWSFGDGGTSTARNPRHTYTTPGVYTVQLVVTRTSSTWGGTGTTTSSHKKVNYITVLGQPDLVVSGLTHTPEAPPLGGPVTFDVTIANQGTAQAGPFTVSLQGAATSVRGMISSLGAGSSTTLQLVLPLSKHEETFRVKADSNWRVVESNESNNTAQHTVSDSLTP